MELTKKRLNAMRHAAFLAFMELYSKEERQRIFGSGSVADAYKIEEGLKTKIVFCTKSQIHRNSLTELGFTDNATVKHFLTVDKQTQTLTYH